MQLRYMASAVLAFVAVFWCGASVESAGPGDFQQTLFRGLEYAGNYNYQVSPQGGPLYNFNQYSQAIQYNRVSGGYTFESFRFFGPDSWANPNTLDLGPIKVQLGTDPTVLQNGQPIALHSRVGYSTRLIPEVFFDQQTGQRIFNQFTGISNFSPAPLNYTVTVDTGVQDFSWTGNAFVDMHGNMNALGFYDFRMRITNVGDYTVDGAVVKDEQVTDFDLGPINASGNVLMDLIGGVWQATGAQTSAIVPRVLDDASQKDKRLDSLLARLRAGEKLSDDDMQYITQSMIAAAFRADPLGVMQNGLPSEVPGFEGLSLAFSQPTQGTDVPATTTSLTPEPGTLVLVASAAAVAAALRRWRRR
ncbi:MAG TPA: PEP-CTERM sorting domain-containing protein [Phycisphaerae bacterium]|nr:PEP-CTERM sorting domain-containing protein [Phycisphaerae bacterium]